MNKKWLAGPYLVWMVGFIVIPLLLIVYYGLTDKSGAFTLANVLSISTPEHVKALWLSLGLSLVSTVICLLLAYPLAMILRNRGIGQGSFVSERSIQQAKELLLPYLDEVLQKEELDLVCYMLTNVLESSTELIFAGEHAGEIVALGFSPDAMEEHSAVLPGVVSRKKQMVPNLSRGISDWQANN